MQQRAVVLGCGLVGATMARELKRTTDITVAVADLSEASLSTLKANGIEPIKADLSDAGALSELIKPFDIVLGALPSRFGFKALETVIRAGKPYCDISFMPESALALNNLAIEKGATAIVDCGVSPGLSNLMVGYAAAQLDRLDQAEIYVGGLPKNPAWPYNYKAPFAPSDVIEEYTRPARLIENGKTVTKPALSEPEPIDLPHAGTLEAFNTDGLRSLLDTVPTANMKEKTLRYPGHPELMRVFRETGLFSKEPVEVGGVSVRPLDLTSKLLFPQWKLDEHEPEFTVLRVIAQGPKNDKQTRYVFDLYDEYDTELHESSMARTTAFPNVVAARMILDGRWTEPGVFPLELLAKHDGIYDHFVSQLATRGVKIICRTETL